MGFGRSVCCVLTGTSKAATGRFYLGAGNMLLNLIRVVPVCWYLTLTVVTHCSFDLASLLLAENTHSGNLIIA
ncbi:hypothetical protein VTL71DRAFT_11591 [Oculimacula yallundae]|uniref:Uncharacterized protein n=1 Tax=Oculimacula yallundae TaxID=86028 RepID=A0ABR4CSB3_9HELO